VGTDVVDVEVVSERLAADLAIPLSKKPDHET
jgi:hypothetical protein